MRLSCPASDSDRREHGKPYGITRWGVKSGVALKVNATNLPPTRIWRAMKFKVLLRKRGGARARAARRELFLETRPFDGSCFLCLSIMLHDTTRGGGSWWSCQLIDPSGWGVGGMAGHAGPPVGPASDVVLPLHSLKKRGAT